MGPAIPDELLQRAAEWEALHRWERSELGKELRRLGLTYGEIRSIVPVPKGTLSAWCREVELTEEQIAAIAARTGPESRAGFPVDTQRKRREEIDRIREGARRRARTLVEDPVWTAGVALYWGEGSKRSRRLEMANADPNVLRFFAEWTHQFLVAKPEFTAALNIHSDNDEPAARRWWAEQIHVDLGAFTKSYVKPDGTGHRKNHLPFGVCRLRLRRSTDAWVVTMTWIEELANLFGGSIR